MKLKTSSSGFSIVEATVAAVIFTIAAAGIFSVIGIMRSPGVESEERIGAAYYAQEILADLRSKVDQGVWDTGDLAPGTYSLSSGIYNATYIVTTDAASGARKVTVTVEWPDS